MHCRVYFFDSAFKCCTFYLWIDCANRTILRTWSLCNSSWYLTEVTKNDLSSIQKTQLLELIGSVLLCGCYWISDVCGYSMCAVTHWSVRHQHGRTVFCKTLVEVLEFLPLVQDLLVDFPPGSGFVSGDILWLAGWPRPCTVTVECETGSTPAVISATPAYCSLLTDSFIKLASFEKHYLLYTHN